MRSLFVLLGVLLATPTFAAEGASGLVSGLLHPILGFDHLMAMVGVGLLSVQIGHKHIWTLPACFVLFLMIGGILGLLEIPLPQVEGLIAASVFVIGLAIASSGTVGATLAYPIVAVFAIFHGHAHGMEVPTLDNPTGYVIGFMVASAVLHIAGVGIGYIVKSASNRTSLGSGMAGIGLYMILLTYGIV
ncbi:MAG: HupE/UreJ family protein [Pseudomonadota bacterium]